MTPKEKFYTAEPIEKEVTKEEFEEFVNNYPRNLTRDWCGICDPPLISYNDFELANRWPYSVVAWTWDYTYTPHGIAYTDEEKHYYIIVNYEELFNSKTGYEEPHRWSHVEMRLPDGHWIDKKIDYWKSIDDHTYKIIIEGISYTAGKSDCMFYLLSGETGLAAGEKKGEANDESKCGGKECR